MHNREKDYGKEEKPMAELPIQSKKGIIHYDGKRFSELEDDVAAEYALTIMLNDDEFATMVCTPSNLEELVYGFLASEGVIETAADVADLLIDENQGMAYVTTAKPLPPHALLYNKRYLTSCCGKSRQSYYFFNDARTAKPVESKVVLNVEDVFRLMSLMHEHSVIFKQTGGVHNAALCNPTLLLAARSDIGRHNALDKLHGFSLMTSLDTTDLVIAFSGRISSEVLLKASKIGVSVILSPSAPTELALNLADELGITAVGFIRGRKLNVYTHAQRIVV
jgi:FdhD protein